MNHSEIAGFLRGVADLIRDTFKPGKYQDVIFPLTVLRRLDCVLEDKKALVLKRQAELRGKGLQDLDQPLRKASGFAFYNTSRYESAEICRDHRGDPEPGPDLRDSESVPLIDGEDPVDGDGVPASVRTFRSQGRALLAINSPGAAGRNRTIRLGQLGRLLITLLFCAEGVLRDPLLYLSLYFKQHRQRYYDLLTDVRSNGDWEAWVDFYAHAVRDTATSAVSTARAVVDLFNRDRNRVRALGRAGGSSFQVHHELQRRPLASIAWLVRQTGLSNPTIGKALDVLVNIDIAREVTGRRRGRVFAYDRYLALLSEGTEQP